MMYAAKLTIDYKPKKIRYQREVKLPDRLLTLEDISKHLKEGEKFEFLQREEDAYIGVYGYRLETNEEVKIRVSKIEKYNENYEKFHLKYKK